MHKSIQWTGHTKDRYGAEFPLHHSLPNGQIAQLGHKAPEKEPVQVATVIHDQYTTVIQFTLVAKHFYVYAIHFLCNRFQRIHCK